MKYTLSTADYYYNKEDSKKLEKLGFTFKKQIKPYDKQKPFSKTFEDDPTIEINTLDDLRKFIETYGRIVINENEITIYDGYLE